MRLPAIDRRQLLIGGGLGAGLVVGIALWPRRPATPYGMAGDVARFDHYLRIDPEGRITAVLPQVETGQGIWTTLAGLIAAELGADPADIAIEPAGAVPGMDNDVLAHQMGGRAMRITAGATSIRAFELPVREAAASARRAMIEEAARQWNADLEDIRVRSGTMWLGDRSLPFSALVEGAARGGRPGDITLSKKADRLENVPRLDASAKAQGSWRFADDVRLPGMIHAAARLAPPFGEITSIDRARASERGTTIDLVERPGWVAALAGTGWEAEQAIAAANIRVRSPRIDSEAIAALMQRALDQGDRETVADIGDARSIIDNADARLGGTFTAHPFPHDTLEPVSACAQLDGSGVMRVWLGSQAPGAAQRDVADATGLPEDKVMLIPMPVGGADGRALENRAGPIAALLAMESGKPVHLTLSHAQSARLDPVGPPMHARIDAVPGSDGRIAAWHARIAELGGLGAAMSRLGANSGRGPDRLAAVPPYGIANLRVDMMRPDIPILTGYRRGHAAMLHCFAAESTVDEVARAIGAEPLAFRIAMLGGNVRLARLAQRVGEIAGWDSTRMGMAMAAIDGSAVALVAEADEGVRGPAVTRLVAAVDCGRAVQPDLVRQQVEAGLMNMLQALLQAPPVYAAGTPLPRSWPKPPPLPEIHIELVDQGVRAPGGISSLAGAVLAPAIANALVARGRKRLRGLPFTRQGTA